MKSIIIKRKASEWTEQRRLSLMYLICLDDNVLLVKRCLVSSIYYSNNTTVQNCRNTMLYERMCIPSKLTIIFTGSSTISSFIDLGKRSGSGIDPGFLVGRDANPPRGGGANLNYMKLKNIGPWGPCRDIPFRCATGLFCDN